MKLRKEFDSIGSINVPNDKYWGASTQRSKKYFDIGEFLVRPILIKSIAIIKKAAAVVHVKEKEILPNIMPPLIAEFGLRFCFVFLTIAALSFLGVGIQPPTADWGSMVRDNASLIMFAQYDLKAGLTPLLPAAAIALLTVAINFVVDWFLHKTSGIRDEQ